MKKNTEGDSMGRADELFARLKEGGEGVIDEFIVARQAEELFLDFKRSADNGRGPRVLHQNDRNTLAKAISGFGNAEGGVIVWGVDAAMDTDGADVARARVLIENPKRFVSWLQNATSGCTVPAHPHVEHHPIEITTTNTGFAASLIRRSEHAPHQAIFDSRYYMRAGSSFVPVPHAVLAGMFGRRPEPELYHMYTVSTARVRPTSGRAVSISGDVGIIIGNKGPGLARDAYLNIKLTFPGQCEFDVTDKRNWNGHFAFGMWMSLVSNDGYRIAPGMIVQPVVLRFTIKPPIKDGLWVELILGCDGAPTRRILLESAAGEVQAAYDAFLAGSQDSKASHEFIKNLFKIEMSSS